MKTNRRVLLGLVLSLLAASPAAAQAPAPQGAAVEPTAATPQEPVTAPAPPNQFELIAPGPSLRDTSRVPEADFYFEDQRVPYDPVFIAPLTGTTEGGVKYGASLWTSPQTPVGSLASQGYQQNNGWFGFGLTIMWDAFLGGPPAVPDR